MDDLPPIVPKPAARDGWDIAAQRFLQLAIEIEVRLTGKPIDSIFLESGRRVGWKRHLNRAGFGVRIGSLIGVMHALPGIARDDLDVHFMIVIFVEESAVTCAGNGASSQDSAHAAVENVIFVSRDFGS